MHLCIQLFTTVICSLIGLSRQQMRCGVRRRANASLSRSSNQQHQLLQVTAMRSNQHGQMNFRKGVFLHSTKYRYHKLVRSHARAVAQGDVVRTTAVCHMKGGELSTARGTQTLRLMNTKIGITHHMVTFWKICQVSGESRELTRIHEHIT